jgi:hypothetical protein
MEPWTLLDIRHALTIRASYLEPTVISRLDLPRLELFVKLSLRPFLQVHS